MYKITTKTGTIIEGHDVIEIMKAIAAAGDIAVRFDYDKPMSRNKTTIYNVVRESEKEAELE
jgi:hypothetical protein